MKTTTARLSLPLSTSQWWIRLEKFLAALYHLYEREPATTLAAQPDTRQLQNRQVLHLRKAEDVSRIHVRQGAVWLTRTPADGDIILRAGDRLHLEHGFPVVVQALRDSHVELWH